jgi:hypothetical protein
MILPEAHFDPNTGTARDCPESSSKRYFYSTIYRLTEQIWRNCLHRPNNASDPLSSSLHPFERQYAPSCSVLVIECVEAHKYYDLVKSVLDDAATQILAQKEDVSRLAEIANKHPFYKYNGVWSRELQNLVQPLSPEPMSYLANNWLGRYTTSSSARGSAVWPNTKTQPPKRHS